MRSAGPARSAACEFAMSRSRVRAILLSRIIRVRLTYDGGADGAPASLILKTGLPARAGREWNAGTRRSHWSPNLIKKSRHPELG